MYHSIRLPGQDRDFDEGESAPSGAETAHPLRLHLLTAAMAPLEQAEDWQPMATLLRTLDNRSALLMQHTLLAAWGAPDTPVDPEALPDATAVALAGLLDAAGRPGRALAMLDLLEDQRQTARFMTMSWQARCHILGHSARIDALLVTDGHDDTGLRAKARRRAAARRMPEALASLCHALDRAPAPRSGLGSDLAVLAAWLHAHGQGALLAQHTDLAHRLSGNPSIAREALDLLMRAPAMPAWGPMREGWLSAARRYFHRFLRQPRLSAGWAGGGAIHCRPAA